MGVNGDHEYIQQIILHDGKNNNNGPLIVENDRDNLLLLFHDTRMTREDEDRTVMFKCF